MSKDVNKKQFIVRKDVYEIYVIWRTIPPLLVKGGEELLGALGIRNETVNEMARIKTQAQFAEKHGIAQETLSDWNKKVRLDERFQKIREWVVDMSSSILVSLGRTAITKGSAPEVKLWFQLVYGWQERVGLGLDLSGGARYKLSPEQKARLDKILAKNRAHRGGDKSSLPSHQGGGSM